MRWRRMRSWWIRCSGGVDLFSVLGSVFSVDLCYVCLDLCSVMFILSCMLCMPAEGLVKGQGGEMRVAGEDSDRDWVETQKS